MPRTSRPPLTSSNDSAIEATSAGERYPVDRTSGPSSTREVASASAGRSDHASQNPGSSATQIVSTPTCSRRMPISRISLQRGAGLPGAPQLAT